MAGPDPAIDVDRRDKPGGDARQKAARRFGPIAPRAAGAALLVALPLVAFPLAAQVWMRGIDVNTEAMIKRIPLRLDIQKGAGPIAGLDLGRDGRHLLAVPAEGAPRLWNLDLGRPVGAFPAGARLAAVVPGGRGVVAAEGDALRHFDGRDQAGRRLAVAGGPITALAVAPDATFIIAGTAGGEVVGLEFATGRETRRIKAHTGAVAAVDVSDTGEVLLSAGADGTAAVWEASTGVRVASHQVAAGPLIAARFALGATRFVALEREGGVSLWRVGAEAAERTFAGSRGAAALAAGGEVVLAAVGEDVRAWSLDGAERLAGAKAHAGGAAAVAVDATGRHAISGGADGLMHVWDLGAGRTVATLVTTEGSWAVIDDEGRFDDGGGALETVRWAVARVSLPIENFSETLFEPGLLRKKRLGSAAWATRPGEILKTGILPPPVARIEAAGEVTVAGDGTFELPVRVTDFGGGIGGLNLFLNGKVVDPDNIVSTATGKDDKGRPFARLVYRVRLVSGRNNFLAEATSAERIVGPPHRLVLEVDVPPRQPSLHVVTIAVNAYKDPRLTLNYALPDAQAIVAALKASGAALFQEVAVHEVHNAAATRRGILGTLEKLAEAAPEDVVVIYLATHGESKGDEYYLLPHDFPSAGGDVARDGVAFADIQRALSRIGAQRIVFFIDACKSGTAIESVRGSTEERAVRRLSMAVGLHVVSATEKNQFAVELKVLGHGVFTYALTQGLAGAADTAPRDGILTVKELVDYAENEVPALSAKYAEYQHWPLAFSRGVDFSLAAVRR